MATEKVQRWQLSGYAERRLEARKVAPAMTSIPADSPVRPGRLSVLELQRRKERGERWAMLTSYDQLTAGIFEAAGVDVLLVGDSAANNVLGYPDTVSVTVDELLPLVRAVVRGTERALVVADLPFGSYQSSPQQTLETSVRFMKEAGAQAVKFEGGAQIAEHARAVVAAGIPVMGHVGFTPQSVYRLGGYRVQGRGDDAERIVDDALALQAAGAFAVVVEMVPAELAKRVTAELSIPDDRRRSRPRLRRACARLDRHGGLEFRARPEVRQAVRRPARRAFRCCASLCGRRGVGAIPRWRTFVQLAPTILSTTRHRSSRRPRRERRTWTANAFASCATCWRAPGGSNAPDCSVGRCAGPRIPSAVCSSSARRRRIHGTSQLISTTNRGGRTTQSRAGVGALVAARERARASRRSGCNVSNALSGTRPCSWSRPTRHPPQLLERVADARKVGATVFALDSGDPELEKLAHESLWVPSTSAPATRIVVPSSTSSRTW